MLLVYLHWKVDFPSFSLCKNNYLHTYVLTLPSQIHDFSMQVSVPLQGNSVFGSQRKSLFGSGPVEFDCKIRSGNLIKWLLGPMCASVINIG